MSHGQTKVSEYFSKRKNYDGLQPSKLRKVMVDEEFGESAITTSSTPPIGSRTRARVNKVSHPTSQVPLRKKTTKCSKPTSKVRIKPENQRTIEFTLRKAHEKVECAASEDKLTEAFPTAVLDNHNGSPPGSPTKRTLRQTQDDVQQITRKRGHCQDPVIRDLFQEGDSSGFNFHKNDTVRVNDRAVLSPRRLSTDGEEKSDVFEFKGKEKTVMKEAKLKELVREFTLASDGNQKFRISPSVLEEGKRGDKQDQSVAPMKDLEASETSLEKLKDKASSALRNPAALKAKLSKCTNIRDLKEKLRMLHPTSPRKNVQQATIIQSPIKSHLTDALKEATSTTPHKAKKPAYERFTSLEEPIPAGLALPKTYKLLLDMFIGMDTVISILHKRSEVCTFSKLKVAIQQMTRRNFELKHLGQIKTVYPTAYHLKQEKNLPCYGKKKSNDYQLTVEVNIVDDPLSKISNVTLLTKDGHPDFTTSKIVERKTTFHRKLIDILRQHHKVFLSSLKPPITIPDHKVTHWHPKFCVENVPEIEPAELPKAENVLVITTAKDALEQVKKFGNNSRIKQALEKVAAKNYETDAQNKVNAKNVASSKLDTNLANKSDEKQALRGVSQSFLEKIRAKEARKQQEAMLRSPADEKKQERMSRLPELVRILRTLFVTSKKPALLKCDILGKLADSYKACMGQVEAECHLDLLTELVPDWISVLKLKRGVFVTIDKNKDINAVMSCLDKLRKEMP